MKYLAWIPIIGLFIGDYLQKKGKFFSPNSFTLVAIGNYQALIIAAALILLFKKIF